MLPILGAIGGAAGLAALGGAVSQLGSAYSANQLGHLNYGLAQQGQSAANMQFGGEFINRQNQQNLTLQQHNEEMQFRNRVYADQKYMAENAAQIRVNDLKKAGLSPILAAGSAASGVTSQPVIAPNNPQGSLSYQPHIPQLSSTSQLAGWKGLSEAIKTGIQYKTEMEDAQQKAYINKTLKFNADMSETKQEFVANYVQMEMEKLGADIKNIKLNNANTAVATERAKQLLKNLKEMGVEQKDLVQANAMEKIANGDLSNAVIYQALHKIVPNEYLGGIMGAKVVGELGKKTYDDYDKNKQRGAQGKW